MKIDFQALTAIPTGAAVYFVEKDGVLSGAAAAANETANGALSRAIEVSRFDGKKGQGMEIVAPVGLDADRVILLGVGDVSELSDLDQVTLGAGIYVRCGNCGSKEAYVSADLDGLDTVKLAEGAAMRAYRFDKYLTKQEDDKKPSLKAVYFGCEDPTSAEEAFTARQAVVEGVTFTKDLTSETPNHLYPESFAAELRELSQLGVDVDVLGEAQMEELGMRSLLAVGQGSRRDSQLVVMRWNGDADSAPLALVGKGVTFDSGGISLKPGAGMDQMKWDMGGAGIVAGAIKALAGRKAKANVIGVVGLVENMPDGNAQRPGDVVTSMSGQTIEVLNTDAEGRMVLADALWYTKEEFKPKMMIDLATLTGAMVISLGHEYAGFFTDDDDIASGLSKAGEETGDKVWRLPLHTEYDKMINTPVADMKNVGERAAGSITAAQFLKRFVGDVPWAHIDVAGVVWADKDKHLCGRGATGYGVRLLDQFVADQFEAK